MEPLLENNPKILNFHNNTLYHMIIQMILIIIFAVYSQIKDLQEEIKTSLDFVYPDSKGNQNVHP